MPLTSLAAQLKRLETPQTALLSRIEKKSRASLLFDPKEAAGFDKDTFYELGLSGLEELTKLNPDFEKFERTLFDPASISFERSVETTEINNKLDEEISKFLVLLLPYFLLRPAHKALEWLIYRYHVEDFNADELLTAALVYHETVTFAKVLRLVGLSGRRSWSWLAPVQKEGVPLSKTALLNRAASDLAFLKSLLDLPSKAIRVWKDKSNSLSTLFAFYCSTAVGALEYCERITDVHVSLLLPSLTEALASRNIPDYTASALVVVARLVTKVSLASPLVAALYNKMSKVEVEGLEREKVLALTVLAQRDPGAAPLPEKAVRRLASAADLFVPALARLSREGVVTAPLLLAVLSTALDAVRLRPLALHLLTAVDCDSELVRRIFGMLLERYKEGDDWWREVMEGLERKYPEEFDRMASRVLRGKKKKKKKEECAALEGMLGSGGEGLERLNHPSPTVRVSALNLLARNYKDHNVRLYVETLALRLGESDTEVLSAVLSLPPALLSPPELRPHLLKAVVRTWEESSLRSALPRALSALLSLSSPTTTTLLAVLPPLLHSNKDKILRTVLDSEFAKKSPLLASLSKRLEGTGNVRSAFLKVLEEEAETLPGADEVESAAEELSAARGSEAPAVQFLTLLLLSASLPHHHQSAKAFSALTNRVLAYLRSPKMSGSGATSEVLDEEGVRKALGRCRTGLLPVEGAVYCVGALSRRSTVGLPWLSPHSPALEVFRVVALALALHSSHSDIAQVFDRALRSFYTTHGLDKKSRIMLGLNVAIYCGEWCGGDTTGAEDAGAELGDEPYAPALLLALASARRPSARAALLDLLALVAGRPSPFQALASHVVAHSEEIVLDAEQVGVCLYTSLGPGKEVQSLLSSEARVGMSSALAKLLHVILLHATPMHIKAGLLNLLEFVTSPELFSKLLPLLGDLVGCGIPSLSDDQSRVVTLVLKRLGADAFADNKTWPLLERVLEDQTTIVKGAEGKSTSPSVLLLQQISKELFDEIPEPKLENQERLLGTILRTAADSENVQVGSATASLFKRIVIDARIVVNLLTSMQTATVPPPLQKTRARTRKSVNPLPPLEILETAEWKRGVCLLELVQTKKKMKSVHLLLPKLFEILKKCLQFEQQAPVEYTKQLVLTGVLHCCQSRSCPPVDSLQVDPVVQCVRASHNPQTHHHALLALTHMARIVPDQVLHNIMAIFTFIGSSVLRQDDAYSFQIISKIVDTIVPVLVKDGGGGEAEVIGCVKVFVSAMLDVPEHRRLPLFGKLLDTLDGGSYLWLFLCLVFDSHVLAPPHLQQLLQEEKTRGHTNEMPKKLEVALQLCLDFPVSKLLETTHKLLVHLLSLPHTKGEAGPDQLSDKRLKSIFDIEANTDKQLRHYKYTLLLFLSSLLSSNRFVQQVAGLSEEETERLESSFTAVVESCLRYIKGLSKQVELSSALPTFKYWKAMLNQSYEILDKTTALLSGGMFVGVVGGLVRGGEGSLVRRGAELLGWRLGQSGLEGSPLPRTPLLHLLPQLLLCLDRRDDPLTVQTSLVTLKLLSRHLAHDHIQQFSQVLGKVSEMLGRREEESWAVVGSLVLCVGELVSSLKAHSLHHLTAFMPPILDVLHNDVNSESGDLFAVSVVTGLNKVVETLSLFLGPYLPKLLYRLSTLSAAYQPGLPVSQKLKTIRQKLSSDLRVRVLVSAVSDCFHKLIKNSELNGVAPLMSLLSDSFTSSGDLTPEVTSFFVEALDFRCSAGAERSAVELVEPHVVSALTSLVLKLSESAFRPLYYKLYDWALRNGQHRLRAITFYRLSAHISESLKGLFVLFAGHVVGNAAALLDKNNSARAEEEGGLEEEEEACLLVDAILRTLLGVFTYDAQHFVNKERFDCLVRPLVDQLENGVGGEERAGRRRSDLVGPCLAQMAVSIADDSLWKQLNYQILLKTRHPSPEVRLGGVRTVCLVAAKLGEDFLPLLPETVPFLAELLEDTEEEVEHETRRVVRDLEAILGEPIQKYF